MTPHEEASFKEQIKTEKSKLLIKTAREMRRFLALLDAEIQSRKGPSK